MEVEPVLDEISFVSPPAVPLICKIHNGIMHDPVIAKCGVTFMNRRVQSVDPTLCYLVFVLQTVPAAKDPGNGQVPDYRHAPDRGRHVAQPCCTRFISLLCVLVLIISTQLSEQIGELMVFCRYQKPAISGVIVEDSEGCKMQIKLKDRS